MMIWIITFRLNGTKTTVINMGSYNYLGFGECEGPCTNASKDSIQNLGVSSCSSRLEAGTGNFLSLSICTKLITITQT